MTESKSLLHPRLQALEVFKDTKNPQWAVAKNAGLNFALAVEPSDLFISRCDMKRQETLYEVPEGPLLFVKSYDEKTQTVVLMRKVFNKLTEKTEDWEVTWTGVPASWLHVKHDSKEYKDAIKAIGERIQKSNANNAKSKGKADLTGDFYNVRSVLMPGDLNLTQRTPLGPLNFFGRGDLMHGNYKFAPENATRKPQKMMKEKINEIDFTATLKADAWQKAAAANVGTQDKVTLLYMAHEDIMDCWYAQWMFQLKLSKYAAEVTREAKDRFTEGWKNREDAYKLTGMSEKKIAAEKKKYDAEMAPKDADMLREMHKRYMSAMSGVTYDFDKTPTGRHDKDGEIIAKFPKAYTERVSMSTKLYKKATEDQKKALQDHPYVCDSEQKFKEREAAMLKQPVGERTPLCHFVDGEACKVCKGIWVKDQMIRHGLRCYRMGYMGKDGKVVPKREMGVNEAADWAQSGAIAQFEYERSLNVDCNMNSMGAKGRLGAILFYSKPPPYQAMQARPVDRTEDVVPGADMDEDDTPMPAVPPPSPEKKAPAEETKKRKAPATDVEQQSAAKKAKPSPAAKKKKVEEPAADEEELVADYEAD